MITQFGIYASGTPLDIRRAVLTTERLEMAQINALLGERIVAVARLAVAVHLGQSLEVDDIGQRRRIVPHNSLQAKDGKPLPPARRPPNADGGAA